MKQKSLIRNLSSKFLVVMSLLAMATPGLAAQIIQIGGSKSDVRRPRTTTYRQSCEKSMAQFRVSGDHAFICAPINSPDALYCINGALRGGVMNVNREHTDGCSWTTMQGRMPLDALYRNRYAFVRGSFIRFVGSPWSYQQAQCYTDVLNRGYPQMDEFQLRSLCP